MFHTKLFCLLRQYDCSRKHYLSELENRGQELCKEHSRILHQVEHITWHLEGCTRHRPCGGGSKKQNSTSSNVSCMSNSATNCNRPSAIVSRKSTHGNSPKSLTLIQLNFISFSNPNKGSFLSGKLKKYIRTFYKEHCGFTKENLLGSGEVGMRDEGKLKITLWNKSIPGNFIINILLIFSTSVNVKWKRNCQSYAKKSHVRRSRYRCVDTIATYQWQHHNRHWPIVPSLVNLASVRHHSHRLKSQWWSNSTGQTQKANVWINVTGVLIIISIDTIITMPCTAITCLMLRRQCWLDQDPALLPPPLMSRFRAQRTAT